MTFDSTKKPAKKVAKNGKKRGSPKKCSNQNISKHSSVNDDDTKMAELVPGWEKLTSEQKAEFAKVALELEELGEHLPVSLTEKLGGGFMICHKGDSAPLSQIKLQRALGSISQDPINARATEIFRYLDSVGAKNETRFNAALSFIESMRPTNQAEVLLLTQMYAAHDAAMRSISQLGEGGFVDNLSAFGNLSTKLMAAYRNHLDALGKQRRGGEQIIKHVHVDNRGGQAVFTEQVNQNGGSPQNAQSQPQEQHTQGDAGPAMLGYDPCWNPVPASGHERQEALQPTRGQVDRTEGPDG